MAQALSRYAQNLPARGEPLPREPREGRRVRPGRMRHPVGILEEGEGRRAADVSVVEARCAEEVEGGVRVWVRALSVRCVVGGDGAFSRYSLVIITNQALKSAALAEWKKKIPLIGDAVGGLRL